MRIEAAETFIKLYKKLPKEMISALMEGLSKKKDDVYGVMGKEFGRVLSKIDLTAEVTKFLERHHVRVQAKFSFEPKEEENGN